MRVPAWPSAALLAIVLALLAPPLAAEDQKAAIERGRYLTKIAGCNDCHTAGYAQAAGDVPEAEWLTGDHLGWRGPWGTTYPGNLRLLADRITETQWVELGRTVQYRPPMPWFALRDMNDADLVAIYRFLRHLGPAGEAVPAWVPPDREPAGPYVQFPTLPH